MGIWSRFDVFVPTDVRYYVSRTDVHLYARQVGLRLLYVDNYCGHTVKVRRFRAYMCDNMSWAYVYVFARQTMLPLCHMIWSRFDIFVPRDVIICHLL